MRIIRFGIQTDFRDNDAPSSSIQFYQGKVLKVEFLNFVPSKRNKKDSKGQKLHDCLIRLEIQVHFPDN